MALNGDPAISTIEQQRGERTVLVVQPDEHCPADLYDDWFTEVGLSLRVVRPFAGEPVPTALVDDALVVLGGAMSANDDELFPWLADIRDLLKVSVRFGTPTLGICLGGQLLAQALGGTVTQGALGPELGVVDLALRADAAEDELFAGLPDPAPAATFHGDVVTELPPDAVVLASSQVYPHQAFRVAAHAWGVQFHPEASTTRFAAWAASAREGTSEASLAGPSTAEVHRRQDETAHTGRQLAQRFATLVGN